MRTLLLSASIALAVAALPGSAEALEKGSSILAIQLTQSVADNVTPEGGTGFITAFDHSEIGVQGQFWYMTSDAWAVTFGAGFGFFREENTPGDNASPGDDDFIFKTASFHGRGGLDRVVTIADDVHLHMGPGVQFWFGDAEFENGTVIETESTTRIALSGRFGALVQLSENFGLMGQLGHYIGIATADDEGAEATWWPSGNEGAAGIAFTF